MPETELPLLSADHVLHVGLNMREWQVVMQGLGELQVKVAMPLIDRLQAAEARERAMLAEKQREEAEQALRPKVHVGPGFDEAAG